MSYVYVRSEKWTDEDGNRHELFTVGFYKPDGSFETESDHNDKGSAAERVAWLNGGERPRSTAMCPECCDEYNEEDRGQTCRSCGRGVIR